MAQYKAFSTNSEVNGEMIISVVEGVGSFKQSAFKILAENGIKNILPSEQYPLQLWLNSLKQISDKIGPTDLIRTGMMIAENKCYMTNISNLNDALYSLNDIYQKCHRGDHTGGYIYEKIDDKMSIIICNNPYPCDFEKGIILAITKKFKSNTEIVRVIHSEKNPCRNKGADSCTFLIKRG